jgi:anti-sigma regulatory factor (Ser/Thr protein kinase)
VEVSTLGDTLRSFRVAQTGEPVYDNLDLGVIEIHYREYPTRLVFEIVDRGRAIPTWLLEQPKSQTLNPDPTDIDNVPEGGRGIPLIRALFDGIEYTSMSGVNRLRLTKTLIVAPAAPLTL